MGRKGEAMAIYDKSPHSESNIAQMIGVQTNLGGYFFDAVLKTDHSSKLKITEHPVEEGASVTDHAYVEPQSLTMEIGMSDVCMSYIDGQFMQKSSRSVSAYEVLKQIQSSRIPLTVCTRLDVYENMLIETISAPDDYLTMFGLKATIGLREIIVVTTSTVALPNRTSRQPQKTGATNKGTVQPVQTTQTGKNPPQSLLKQILGGFK